MPTWARLGPPPKAVTAASDPADVGQRGGGRPAEQQRELRGAAGDPAQVGGGGAKAAGEAPDHRAPAPPGGEHSPRRPPPTTARTRSSVLLDGSANVLPSSRAGPGEERRRSSSTCMMPPASEFRPTPAAALGGSTPHFCMNRMFSAIPPMLAGDTRLTNEDAHWVSRVGPNGRRVRHRPEHRDRAGHVGQERHRHDHRHPHPVDRLERAPAVADLRQLRQHQVERPGRRGDHEQRPGSDPLQVGQLRGRRGAGLRRRPRGSGSAGHPGLAARAGSRPRGRAAAAAGPRRPAGRRRGLRRCSVARSGPTSSASDASSSARSRASWRSVAATSEKLKSTIHGRSEASTITFAARSDRWATRAPCRRSTSDQSARSRSSVMVVGLAALQRVAGDQVHRQQHRAVGRLDDRGGRAARAPRPARPSPRPAPAVRPPA